MGLQSASTPQGSDPLLPPLHGQVTHFDGAEIQSLAHLARLVTDSTRPTLEFTLQSKACWLESLGAGTMSG